MTKKFYKYFIKNFRRQIKTYKDVEMSERDFKSLVEISKMNYKQITALEKAVPKCFKAQIRFMWFERNIFRRQKMVDRSNKLYKKFSKGYIAVMMGNQILVEGCGLISKLRAMFFFYGIKFRLFLLNLAFSPEAKFRIIQGLPNAVKAMGLTEEQYFLYRINFDRKRKEKKNVKCS